jgi:predicted kinase
LYSLVDFYKCYRAVVRVKINCFHLQENNHTTYEKSRLLRKINRYLDFAYQYAIQFTRPTIWVICGLPAAGKSSIARKLAETLNIEVMRSDEVRKELHGLQPLDRCDEVFEEGIYSKEASSHTYAKLLLLAQEELKKGCSVILDATYARQRHRDGVLCLANDLDANIIFIECEAPYPILKKRLLEREATHTISDARLHHLNQMRARYEPLTEIHDELHIRVDTDMPIDESMPRILSHDHFSASRQIAQLMKIRLSDVA